jgi:hypothetical protein
MLIDKFKIKTINDFGTKWLASKTKYWELFCNFDTCINYMAMPILFDIKDWCWLNIL